MTLEELLALSGQAPLEPRGYPFDTPMIGPPMERAAPFDSSSFDPGMPAPVPPQQLPQPSGGGRFAENFGLNLAQSPIQYQPRRGASDLENFLGGLLSSGANSFGAGAARSVGERESFNERQRVATAERNRENLRATREANEKRWARGEAGRTLREARMERERERQAANEESDRRAFRDEHLLRGRPERGGVVRGAGGYDESDQSLAPEAQAIHEGRIDLPLANKRRTALIAYMDAHGMDYTPKKVREVVAESGQMREALRQLKDADSGLPRGRGGAGRFVSGLRIKADAVTQREGSTAASFLDKRESMKAAIGRLAGHVGVLTERDVQTAVRMLPDEFATRDFADRKFADLESFLNSKVNAYVRAYTQPNAGRAQSDEPADFEFVPGRGLVPVRR